MHAGERGVPAVQRRVCAVLSAYQYTHPVFLCRYAEDWNATNVAFKYDAGTAAKLTVRGHNVSSTAWGAIVQARGGVRGGCREREGRLDAAPATCG